MRRLARGIHAFAPAVLVLAMGAHAADEGLLPAEKAFAAQARAASSGVTEVRFDIAPDHYLYRKRFRVELDGKAVPASRLGFPKGKVKQDPTFGRVETYEGVLTLRIRVNSSQGGMPASLKVVSQGCAAKAGVCYPPFSQEFALTGQSGVWLPAQTESASAFSTGSSVQKFTRQP